MSTKMLQRQGDQIARRTCVMWNRTGATLSRGQIAMMDILDTETETTAGPAKVGDANGAFGTVTTCASQQTPINNGFPLYVALEDIADNAKGEFLIEGVAEVACLDDGTATTDADKGDGIALLVSESATAAQALANGGRVLGIWLEDAAVDANNTDRKINSTSHLRWAIWTGGKISSNLDA